VVGKGAFGKVRIVEKKETGLTFALKYIRKEEGTPLEPRVNTAFLFLTDIFLLQWFGRKVFGTLFVNGECSSI
jgi:serine/threonine kinase 32